MRLGHWIESNGSGKITDHEDDVTGGIVCVRQ